MYTNKYIFGYSYHTLSLFKIQHVCYNNFKPAVITPSKITVRPAGSRKFVTGAGAFGKIKMTIALATRLEEKTKTKNKTKNYNTRHAGIHLAQRLKIQRETRL